jgi:hypothetical protein
VANVVIFYKHMDTAFSDRPIGVVQQKASPFLMRL